LFVQNSIHVRCFEKEKSYANQITVASLNTINLIIVIESKNIFLLRWCLCTTHSGRCGCELFWERKSYANQITLASVWIQ